MRQFSTLQAIALAGFSRELYRDVYLRWQGLGLNYLLALNMLIFTPAIIFTILTAERNLLMREAHGLQLQPNIAKLVDEFIDQLPTLVFDNGTLSTDVAQPYHLHITATDGSKIPVAIIDLDAAPEQLLDAQAFVLLTREAVYTNAAGTGNLDMRRWDEMGHGYFELTPDIARQQVALLLVWLQDNLTMLMALLGGLLWVGTLLVMFIYRALQAFLLGAGAWFIAQQMQFSLRYSDAVRLSCLAMTPPLLLDVIFALLLEDRMHWALFLLLTTCYQLFAIKSIRQLEAA